MVGRFAYCFRSLAAIALLAIAGCSDPYPTDSPRVVDPDTGAPMTGLLSFCYGTRMNSPEDIKTAAAENCSGTLVFVEQDVMFNDCSLLQHARVTYQCRPLKEQGVVGRNPDSESEE